MQIFFFIIATKVEKGDCLDSIFGISKTYNNICNNSEPTSL